jgi:hypothetical protein
MVDQKTKSIKKETNFKYFLEQTTLLQKITSQFNYNAQAGYLLTNGSEILLKDLYVIQVGS